MSESAGERRSMAGRTLHTSDDHVIGTVEAVEGLAMLVSRNGGRVYVPLTAIQSVDNDHITLAVSHTDLDDQSWESPPNEARDAVATTTSTSVDEPATAELLGRDDALPEHGSRSVE